jgi:ketosteroid isomerase-like protein
MTSSAARASALVAVLRAAVEGDLETVAGLCADDVRVWSPARAASSRQELLDTLGERDQELAYSDVEIVPLDVRGPYACAEWSVTLTRRAPAGEGPAARSDAGVSLHGATVAEFRDGEICALRLYWDEATVLERLGAGRGSGTRP